jgi:hypothetical protein
MEIDIIRQAFKERNLSERKASRTLELSCFSEQGLQIHFGAAITGDPIFF